MCRFTIRDVLWLTVVVALAVGWALDHWHSPDSQLRHRAYGLRWALEREGWLVYEEGWTVTVRKAGQKVPEYEVGLASDSVK